MPVVQFFINISSITYKVVWSHFGCHVENVLNSKPQKKKKKKSTSLNFPAILHHSLIQCKTEIEYDDNKSTNHNTLLYSLLIYYSSMSHFSEWFTGQIPIILNLYWTSYLEFLLPVWSLVIILINVQSSWSFLSEKHFYKAQNNI